MYEPAPLTVGTHCEKELILLQAKVPGVHGPVRSGGVDVPVAVAVATVEDVVFVKVMVENVDGVKVVLKEVLEVSKLDMVVVVDEEDKSVLLADRALLEAVDDTAEAMLVDELADELADKLADELAYDELNSDELVIEVLAEVLVDNELEVSEDDTLVEELIGRLLDKPLEMIEVELESDVVLVDVANVV